MVVRCGRRLGTGGMAISLPCFSFGKARTGPGRLWPGIDLLFMVQQFNRALVEPDPYFQSGRFLGVDNEFGFCLEGRAAFFGLEGFEDWISS